MNEVIQMMLYGAPDIYDYLAASCPQPHLHACEMKGFVSRVPTKGNHQKNMTKPNSHNTQHFSTKTSPSKDDKVRTPTQGGKLHPRKSKKEIFQNT